jgi:modification methylase
MVDDELRESALEAVRKGTYDKDYRDNGVNPSESLLKLIEQKRDEHMKRHAIDLRHGDFYEEIKHIPDGSIDAIITDPPYNISRDRVYTRDGCADISKDFGEWDRVDDAEMKRLLVVWATEFARVLKAGGSGFMFVADLYMNDARAALAAAGLEIRQNFYWCKTNPGTSMTKADLMPAVEIAVQFSKPGAPRTFNYPGDAGGAGLSWRSFSICNGDDERIKAENRNKHGASSLHPTQKPEAVIAHLMELITVHGDLVLDGFAGVGTTAAVAKRLSRKFIGWEIDGEYFEAGKHRVG